MAREKKAEKKAEPKAKAKAPVKPKAEAKGAKAKPEPKPKADAKSKPEPKSEARQAPRFAVIQAQGMQFRVAQDEEHVLPNLGQDLGSKITIERVLLISDGNGVAIGKPLIEGAVV